MSQPNPSRDERTSALSRRTALAGAGVVGAAAVAATVLPGVARNAAPVPAAAAVVPSTGGYQLTEHIQRYYQTARV